jgi:FkbM family methyltransferase
MRVLDRRVSDVLRAPLQRGHYRALAGMVRTYPDPVRNARRYVSGWGEYPYRCRLRTPSGTIAPTLYSRHDMLTINEVFCREDYRLAGDLRVAVDIGSNIGLSALYFLTRSPAARVYVFEPDPRNVERLRANLAGYEDRYSLQAVAVAHSDGEAAFGTEPSGRYGLLTPAPGTGHPLFPPTEQIRVRTRAMNDVLGEVLAREHRIDVLKVDTEGMEVELVASIRDSLLDRIASIIYESAKPERLHESRYEFSFACLTNRLTPKR